MSRRLLLGASAIVFVASAARTIAASAAMSAMGEMPMPGGWSLSHMWMVMPGQSWSHATAAFVGMWSVMMVAMMLPSLTPSLLRYQQSMARGVSPARASFRVATAAAAYFGVWAAVGALVFTLGALLGAVAAREPAVARAVPTFVLVVLPLAAVVQLAQWKEQYRARCRNGPTRNADSPVDPDNAWRYGFRLGAHCVRACAGLMAIALCLGLMDVRVMAAMTLAVTAERRWYLIGHCLLRETSACR